VRALLNRMAESDPSGDIISSIASLLIAWNAVPEDFSAARPVLVAPIADLVDGRAVLDESQRTKQPDWTHDAVDSGKWPADRLDDRRAV